MRWPYQIAPLLVACACGRVAPRDAGVDSSATPTDAGEVDGRSDASFGCGDSGVPGHSSCCEGGLCNGFCGGTACTCRANELVGCPASQGCCWNSRAYRCASPNECATCDAVGSAAGLEACCSGPRPDEHRYCRGTCGDPKDAFFWCTCGSTYGGCNFGPDYPDQVCCKLSDGGSGCFAGKACP